MKPSTIYCCLFLLTIAAASCKKDSAGDNASHKITSYVDSITAIGGKTVQTYNVSYDDQGRITSIESTNKHGARIIYKYSAENSFTCDKYADTLHMYHSIYFINSQSLIDSTWGHEYKELPYKQDTTSTRFIYDADKKLIRQMEFLNSSLVAPVRLRIISYQYDLNGTLVKALDENNYGDSYAYDKDLKNTVQLEPFYFPFKEDLPSHTFSTQSSGSTYEIKHTYTFDDHKRVISETQVRSDGPVTRRTYTYEK